MKVDKTTGNIGATISDISLQSLNDDEFEAIQNALFTYGVIFFRNQTLSPDGHIALAQRFGNIDINRFFTPVSTHPNIAEVRTRPEQKNAVIGGSWHSDHSYDPAPAMASILVAREVPPYGGDTMFASMSAACNGLSDGLRAMLDGMNAWHSDGSFANSDPQFGLNTDDIREPNLHPVIVQHPQTGQKAVYVNGDFTTHFEGWTREESAPLLSYLYRAVTRPEYCCRFQWQEGSVAIWDNRLVQHLAVADYQGHARLMHRITIDGQPLVREG